MKIIVIDPSRKLVDTRVVDGTDITFRAILGGDYAEHHVGEDSFPGHKAYVYTNGLIKGLPTWFLNGVIVWGPLILLSKSNDSVELPLQTVQNKVRFT
jgi:hypothetical protein